MIAQAEYLQGKGFIAEVIRTQRTKTASIKVEEGAVSVIVPLTLPTERIERLLKDKHSWIKDKIFLDRKALPQTKKQYISGEAFSYLGRNYRLKIEQGNYTPVKLLQGRLLTIMPEDYNHYMVRNTLVRWYKKQADTKLKQKVKRYAKLVGEAPSSVNIKHFKSRWGSCSPDGKIDFNWTIIMAPNRIVDYIVVHELCHLKQHDHSPKFWKEVERVIPDYAECREWLKMNGETLIKESC